MNKSDLERFLFHGLDPHVFVGTASDRYAGWIGQIYSRDRYAGRIKSRTRKIGGKSFEERTLPVECVEEYFKHFRVLEVDYTFYQFLLDDKGSPTGAFRVLSEYRKYLGPGDLIIVKAPQVLFARRLFRKGVFLENELYLNGEAFVGRFLNPLKALLGDHLRGIIFEQEYRRKKDRDSPEKVAEELNSFFASAPEELFYHVELRTDAYLSEPVFQLFRERGIGQVLSHWTWLPSLRDQFRASEGRFFNAAGNAIIRLMTPRGMRYEAAYAKAHPFDRLVEGMLQPAMLRDSAMILRRAVAEGVNVHLIANNRAGGNAPLVARSAILEFMKERMSEGS